VFENGSGIRPEKFRKAGENFMDRSAREITKIAREVSSFTVQSMKEEGVGTAEFDFIHQVRHHPGITQAKVRETLKIDKGAAARRAASLEAKGYLLRKENPTDRRSKFLFATEKAENLKNSKAFLEAAYYEWLLEGLEEGELASFLETLHKLYLKSKRQSRAGFPDIKALVEKKEGE